MMVGNNWGPEEKAPITKEEKIYTCPNCGPRINLKKRGKRAFCKQCGYTTKRAYLLLRLRREKDIEGDRAGYSRQAEVEEGKV